MSSGRVIVLCELYRFITGLIWSELSKPYQDDSNNTVSLDAQNDRDFYKFEMAMTAVSGAFDQLERDARDQVLSEEEIRERTDHERWARVEAALISVLERLGLPPQEPDLSDSGLEQDTSDPNKRVRQLVENIVNTGNLDRTISLLCLSESQLRQEVDSSTKLNTMAEGLYLRKSWRLVKKRAGSVLHNILKSQPSRPPAECLFSHLSTRSCREHNRHDALLQLSGWDDEEGKAVFHMYLSCLPVPEAHRTLSHYQETSCTLERKAPLAPKSSINLCKKDKHSQQFRKCLELSFNDTKLWATLGKPKSRLCRKINLTQTTLEELLFKANLKKANLNVELSKFRLAFRLASSLHQLYLGPWVQNNWTPANIYLVHDPETEPMANLDKPYVQCVVTSDWECQNPVIEASKRKTGDCCTKFFLSFAQLLVDIAKGEVNSSSSHQDIQSWYDYLAEEVTTSFQGKLMEPYGRAIEGCLLYLDHCDTEEQRTENTTLRARHVIYQHIVSHLQDHITNWEAHSLTEKEDMNVGDNEAISRRCNHCQPGNNMTTLESLPPIDRHKSTAMFTLFSDEDNENALLGDQILEKSEHDFTTYMKNFLESYIAHPSNHYHRTGTQGSFQNVRVAIVDTGLYIDGNDPVFQGAESRVKLKQSFVGASHNWIDINSHGTHVARLLLRYAPTAEVYVAKISDSRHLEETNVDQLVNALQWAGEHADIINLSFGLGQNCPPKLGGVIDHLVRDKKLIFAAASNTGGNGSRPWPAKHKGVFCIHATDERGVANLHMNPTALSSMDNFSALGINVESYWDGKKRCISGTSFATPVAAAIAANVLHFAREHLSKEDANLFMRYGVMRILFRNYMTENGDSNGVYHYMKPWGEKLWKDSAKCEDVVDVLKDILIDFR
ncbi:hypothetical protein NM208_g8294 [Fusarium decemcellulare]|uniref:Uncharacterized protein n=1 Tax=Fusarium decemcellulare TaxID=57161 RepID=A0ACC1S647_9HYPO|nr:hypothetical protein NM208_g8294 [Fusarium decemcellulare]